MELKTIKNSIKVYLNKFMLTTLYFFMLFPQKSISSERWNNVYPERHSNTTTENKELNIYLKSALFFFLKKDYVNTISTIKKFNLTEKSIRKNHPNIFEKSVHLHVSSLISLNLPTLALSEIKLNILIKEKNKQSLRYWYRSTLEIAKVAYRLGDKRTFESAIETNSNIEKKLADIPKNLHQFKDFLIFQNSVLDEKSQNHAITDQSPSKTDTKLKLWSDEKFLLPPSDLDNTLLESISLQNTGIRYFNDEKYEDAASFFQKSNKLIKNYKPSMVWKSSKASSIKNKLRDSNNFYMAKILFLNQQYKGSLSLIDKIEQQNPSHLIMAGWSAYQFNNYPLSKKYLEVLANSDKWSVEKLEALSLLPDSKIQAHPELSLDGYLKSERAISNSLLIYDQAIAKTKHENFVYNLADHYIESQHHEKPKEISVTDLLINNTSEQNKSILKKVAFWKKLKTDIKSNSFSEQLEALNNKWINLSRKVDARAVPEVSEKLQKELNYLKEMQEKSMLSIIDLYEIVKTKNEPEDA